MADSRKIFSEILTLIKDALDPEFQETTMIEQLKVVIDDVPDKKLTTGNCI